MDLNVDEFFREATTRICGSLDIRTSMARSLAFIKDYIPAFSMHLCRFEPELWAMRILLNVRIDGGKELEELIPMPENALDDIVWSEDELVRIMNRPEEHPVAERLAQAYGKPDCSQIVMHMRRQGEGIYELGSLAIAADGRDRYSEKHSRLFALLNEPVAIAVSNALHFRKMEELKNQLAEDNKYLNQELIQLSGDEVVGSAFGLKNVIGMIRKVAFKNSPVLLLGETGVGKEVIANVLHSMSPRRDNPFIKMNCASIPETLLDSELFGHEHGAFTGAISRKRGRFERAHEGTILLDEIGELPPAAQARLLRVLQNKEIERVGGTKTIKVNVRIIAATNRDIEGMVQSGKFREDLFYRLNVYPITIPPLRERKEDIPALVQYFIERKSREMGFGAPPEPVPGYTESLMNYDWPGNARELENTVERALIQYSGTGPLLVESPTRLTRIEDKRLKNYGEDQNLSILTLDELTAAYITAVLKITSGKVSGPAGAAEILGLKSSTLRNRMKRLGIPYGRGNSLQNPFRE